jgi:dienelactone hydrolase
VVGQSNGGMVSLGYAATESVARGVINFAGRIYSMRPDCNRQQGMIGRGAGSRGARQTAVAVDLHGDRHVFPPQVSHAFFDAYTGAGGVARLQMFPKGGRGHVHDASRRAVTHEPARKMARDAGHFSCCWREA